MDDPTMQHPPAESGRVAFLLGGQGTQYFGMAHSLLDHDPVFRSTVKSLDGLVSERCERSVLDYLYDPGRGFGDRCDDLLMTNLGLLMVEYALAKSLEERGVRPEVIVGSSLGRSEERRVGEECRWGGGKRGGSRTSTQR